MPRLVLTLYFEAEEGEYVDFEALVLYKIQLLTYIYDSYIRVSTHLEFN